MADDVVKIAIITQLKNSKEVMNGINRLDKGVKNIGKNSAEAADKTKGFRFEFLGLMFAGMAMSRVFTNMLRPAAEMFGLFDMWTSTLQVVFLPIMELIMPMLMSMMEWFMNLPEGVQLAIGAFALVGLGIGKLFSVIGQLALAFDSIKIAGPAVIKFFTGFGGVTKIFGVMKAAALFLFSPAGLILVGIALLVVAIVLLIKHWDDVKVAAIKAWNGIKDIMESVINWAINKINDFIDKIPDFVKDKLGIEKIGLVEFEDTPLPPPPQQGNNMSIAPNPNQFGGGLPFMNQTINADITINDVPPGNEAQAGGDVVEQLKGLGVAT